MLNGVKTAYNGISSAISVGTDLMGGIGKVGKMARDFLGVEPLVMEGEF